MFFYFCFEKKISSWFFSKLVKVEFCPQKVFTFDPSRPFVEPLDNFFRLAVISANRESLSPMHEVLGRFRCEEKRYTPPKLLHFRHSYLETSLRANSFQNVSKKFWNFQNILETFRNVFSRKNHQYHDLAVSLVKPYTNDCISAWPISFGQKWAGPARSLDGENIFENSGDFWNRKKSARKNFDSGPKNWHTCELLGGRHGKNR